MRPRSLACLVVALCAVPAAFAAVKPPNLPKLTADIPGQSLSGALGAFVQETGFNVTWPPEKEAVTSRGAQKGATPADALKQLLRCTTLRFTFENARTVRIFDSGKDDPECAPPAEIEEVTITGTRWEQRIIDPPIDSVVWTPAMLEASGVKGIADIAALTPGVSFDFFSSVGSGIFTDIVIRGISDRHGSATGIFFDDTPLPAARSNTFGRALPPYFDLNTIEVLRGPQGTLQGAYTQGGAVRFTPNQPELDRYSGFAHGEWAFTERGRPSYELGAAAGGPLVEDRLGFRFSAWQRSEGGYVDRVIAYPGYVPPFPVVDSDANRLTVQSVRGVLEYDPSTKVKLLPSVTYVSSHAPDSPSFFTAISNPGAGELNNGSLIAQPFDDSYIIGSLRVIARLGINELDSRTSYYHRKGDLVVDDTQSVKWGGWQPPPLQTFPASPDNLVATDTALRQSVFSQELRLISPDAERTTWTAGASYYKTRDLEGYHVTAQQVTVEYRPGAFYSGRLDAYNSTPTVQTQFGVFGDLNRNIARHFDLNVGLRLEYQEYEGHQTEPVSFVTPAEAVPPQNPVSGRNTVLVPRVKLTYRSTTDELYYLLAARGYAPAGVDAALPTCFEDLSTYPLDTVWSYELGTHRSFLWLDHRFTLTAALFDARWDNGPKLTSNCLVTHIPGSATSRGFDVRGDASVGSVLAHVEVSYVDAHYTQTTTEEDGSVIANSGDALGTPPLVASPWNVLASLEQTLALGDSANVTLRAEDAYHSHNPGPFYTSIQPPADANPNNPNLYAPALVADPATNLLNLRVTVNFSGANPVPGLCHCKTGSEQELSFAVFLNNAFDSQPTLLKRNKGADNMSNLFYATTFRPRTVGLAGTWRF